MTDHAGSSDSWSDPTRTLSFTSSTHRSDESSENQKPIKHNTLSNSKANSSFTALPPESPLLLRVAGASPFAEFVLRTLLVEVSSYVGDLWCCCATLYIYRTDPALLRTLTQLLAEQIQREDTAKNAQDGALSSPASAPSHNRTKSYEGSLTRRPSKGLLIGQQQQTTPAKNSTPLRRLPTIHSTDALMGDSGTTTNNSEGLVSLGMVFGKSNTSNSALPQLISASRQPPSNNGQSKKNFVPQLISSDRVAQASFVVDESQSNNAAGQGDPTNEATSNEIDDLVVHILSQLQHCVGMYFSHNWDVVPRLVQLNNEYKTFVMDQLIPKCLAVHQSDRNGVEDGGGRRIKLGQESLTFPSRPLHPLDDDEGYNIPPTLTWGTSGTLRALYNDEPGGLVLCFHAQFSLPSCETVRVLDKVLQSRETVAAYLAPLPTDPAQQSDVVPPTHLPKLVVINCATEPRLVWEFHVTFYPKVMLLPPRSSSSSSRGSGWNSTTAVSPRPEEQPPQALSPTTVTVCPTTQKSSSHDAGTIPKRQDETTATIAPLSPPPESPASGSPCHRSHPVMGPAPSCCSPIREKLHALLKKAIPFPDGAVRDERNFALWIATTGKSSNNSSSSSASGVPALKTQKKLRDLVTRAMILDARLRFKPHRALHSTCLMIQQLQGTGTDREEHTEQNPPRFIFLGGGMAAGKSTAVKSLTSTPWWERFGSNAVVVSADAFKLADPIYESHSSDLHDQSTKQAEQLLVFAVNLQRDIVFDGTMTWRPFVEQTIQMVRTSQRYEYRCGPGYQPQKNIEQYWEIDGLRKTPLRIPYEIHLLAVTVDPEEAVPRAIVRQLSQGRGVPIRPQLRSFQLFAQSFEQYAALCDSVVLLDNNVWVELDKGQTPPVIALKTPSTGQLNILDPEGYASFLKQRGLNVQACCVEELYPPVTVE